MNKKVKLILSVVLILIIGSVTVWHSFYISDRNGNGLRPEDRIETSSSMANEGKSNSGQNGGLADNQIENTTEGLAEELPEAVLVCKNNVVYICCECGGGNAVLLCENEDCYLLCTAAHVVSSLDKKANENLQIEIGGQRVCVNKLWISDTYDVAFLEIPKSIDANSRAKEDLWEGKLTTGLSQDGYLNLKEGDLLWAWSYFDEEVLNLEIQVKSSWIYIEDFGYHMIWGTAEDSKGGMSGSGVFDREGHLAGILCGGNETEVVVLPANIIFGELKNSSIDIFFEQVENKKQWVKMEQAHRKEVYT